MKAVSYSRDRGLVYGDQPDPEVGPGEVLVRVHYAGICGSDLHLFKSRRLPDGAIADGWYRVTGLPYAMGAKLAFPGRPVCLIAGDSAFGFNLQELETARRHEIKIVAIVNVDRAWGMERASQKRIFGDERYMNCEHVPIRYDELARVMGCHGEFVSRPQEIRLALDRCLASGLPAVIHAEVDAQANINPPGMELWVGSHAAH